jgi:Uma2 family endonuclease
MILEDTRKMTVAEFTQLDIDDHDTHLYELIDGEPVKRNAPAPRHQRVLRKLVRLVDDYVRQHDAGEVFFSPIDVFLDEFNAPQPDLVFVGKDQRAIVTGNGIEGVPLLVVEVVSPTSAYRDRVTKKSLYERCGVAEYWLVDPLDDLIEIFGLTNGRYELLGAATPDEGNLTSAVLPGIPLNARALLTDDIQ